MESSLWLLLVKFVRRSVHLLLKYLSAMQLLVLSRYRSKSAYATAIVCQVHLLSRSLHTSIAKLRKD